MQCFIYKSLKKQDIYLYLKNQDDFHCLPEALQNALGGMEFVFSLDLTPARKLANADPVAVLSHLEKQGYFLQLPPPLLSALH